MKRTPEKSVTDMHINLITEPKLLYTRQEVLGLDKKTEAERYQWLISHGILCIRDGYSDDAAEYESLADCAFRLRDELVHKDESFDGYRLFVFFIGKIGELVDSPAYNGCRDERGLVVLEPIHWIQAALLDKLEAEK